MSNCEGGLEAGQSAKLGEGGDCWLEDLEQGGGGAGLNASSAPPHRSPARPPVSHCLARPRLPGTFDSLEVVRDTGVTPSPYREPPRLATQDSEDLPHSPAHSQVQPGLVVLNT